MYVNAKAELVTLAPGLRPERRFAPLARGLNLPANCEANRDKKLHKRNCTKHKMHSPRYFVKFHLICISFNNESAQKTANRTKHVYFPFDCSLMQNAGSKSAFMIWVQNKI